MRKRRTQEEIRKYGHKIQTHVYLTDDELRMINFAANFSGLSRSEFMAICCTATAQKLVGDGIE